MKRVFTLQDGLELVLADPGPASGDGAAYPTASLQRGLLLVDGADDLSGEGVGFGVPVLKRGPRAVFAGRAEIAREAVGCARFTMTYVMDRAERLGGRRRASGMLIPLDLAREVFALLYRRAPALRRALLVCSNGIRLLLRVQTRFEPIPPVARIPVTYSTDGGASLRVQVDLTGLPQEVTEVVVMNELGAPYFADYVEEGGRAASGRRIGAWDPVRARTAAFSGGPGGVWFALQRAPDPAVPRARLFRGREMARGRLAWAGFGYSLQPGPPDFSYTVRVGRRSIS